MNKVMKTFVGKIYAKLIERVGWATDRPTALKKSLLAVVGQNAVVGDSVRSLGLGVDTGGWWWPPSWTQELGVVVVVVGNEVTMVVNGGGCRGYRCWKWWYPL